MKGLGKISLLCVAVLALSVSMLTACSGRTLGRNEPEEVVTLFNDNVIAERYMEAVNEYDHVIYEQVYFDWGGRSIGPTEYRFRGIIYLTDEEAERLWNEYDWEEKAAPEFEFGKIDKDSIGDGPWYSCNQFNSDNYSAIVPNYTVFDGEKLVFDIHQI